MLLGVVLNNVGVGVLLSNGIQCLLKPLSQ